MKKLIIEKNKLQKNIEIIKETTNAEIIAVLKGNGYGLGILEFAEILIKNDITFFAVSEIEEAIQLRQNGFDNKVLLLSSTCIEEEVSKIIQYNIIPTIGSINAAKMMNKVAKDHGTVVDVHIKIDTGFGRFGFSPDQPDTIVSLAKSLNHIKIVGIYSHLSFSFSKRRKEVQMQLNKFISSTIRLQKKGLNTGMLHIANSCAFLRFPAMHFDAVRVGSAFLGRLAIPNHYGLERIAYFKADICEIKTLAKGHYIGYANTYKTKKETKIAVIPVGYKDGFGIEKSKDIFRLIDIIRYIYHDLKLLLGPRKLYVTINGQKARILGRISMYNIIVDVTDLDVKIGDEAILQVNPILVESSIPREYI